MRSASAILDPLSVININSNSNWLVYPNPVNDRITVITKEPVNADIVLEWLTLDGALVKGWIKSYSPKIELNDIPELSRGMYFLRIRSGKISETIKLSKL